VGGALVVVLVGVAVVVSSSLSSGRTSTWNALVPAYFRPGEVADIAKDHAPRLLVVNPDSGPGTQRHDDYASAVGTARDAGSAVLGYVQTGYGTRAPATVREEIERYRAWYGVDGIFLDETSHDAAHLDYYRELADAVRAAGLTLVALNPGTVPAPGYFALADVVVTFEGPAADYAAALARSPDWLAAVPRSHIAHLVYAASPDAAQRARVLTPAGDALYLTPGELPNPWGAPSPYASG
jgi:Spherulation-specific family 4